MNEKERILMVVPEGLERGGIQSVVMCVVRELSSLFTFDIVLLKDSTDSNYEEEFNSFGGNIYKIDCAQNSDYSRLHYYIKWNAICKRIKHIIKSNEYIAVHCHNDYSAGFICCVAERCGIPVRIVHFHTDSNCKVNLLRTMFNHLCLKFINKYASMVLGCSTESIPSKVSENSLVINNPYNETRFIYRDLRPTGKKLVLIHVGAYSVNKNQIFNIKLIELLKEKIGDVELRLIGFELDTGYRALLDKLVVERKLTECVKFYPGNTPFENLLASSNYFLFPSLKEGFGIALIEAQAVGLHCFVSDTVPKTTNQGGCTYLPLDTELWANRIIEQYNQDMGKHHQYCCDSFSQKRVCNEYLKIYKDGR